MDPNLLQLLVAGGLTLVSLVITVLIWRSAKVKTVVWWLGFSMIPIAIYLVGLAPRVVDAWDTLRGWYEGLVFSPLEWTGIGLFGLGALLMLVSRVIPAKPRRKPDAAPASAVRGSSPAAVTPGAPAAPVKRTTASQPTPADNDLDEVTEILKRRGIE